MIGSSHDKHAQIAATFAAFLLLISTVQTQYLPIKCRKLTGTTCIIRTNCGTFNKAMEKGEHHKLASCGWNDGVQYLCCPNSEVNSEVVTEAAAPSSMETIQNRFEIPNARDAKDACQKYKKLPDVNIDKILYGEDAQKGEFPHMVGLGAPPDNEVEIRYGECGGTLISKDYVLTAAHCTKNRKGFSHVRMGKLNANGDDGLEAVDRRINNFVYFNRDDPNHDIVLLKLEKEVQFSDYVRPACLYTEPNDPKEGIVTGWGSTHRDRFLSAIILQKGNISTVDYQECGRLLNKTEPEYITCGLDTTTRSKKKIDTCQGDSGGPFMILENRLKNIYSVFGVTSNGIGCGGENVPGRYARVSYYIKWIESVVWGTSK